MIEKKKIIAGYRNTLMRRNEYIHFTLISRLLPYTLICEITCRSYHKFVNIADRYNYPNQTLYNYIDMNNEIE